jgi:hypothetical protein
MKRRSLQIACNSIEKFDGASKMEFMNGRPHTSYNVLRRMQRDPKQKRVTNSLRFHVTYQCPVVAIRINAGLMHKDRILCGRIFGCWVNETKTLLIRKPFDRSTDLGHVSSANDNQIHDDLCVVGIVTTPGRSLVTFSWTRNHEVRGLSTHHSNTVTQRILSVPE